MTSSEKTVLTAVEHEKLLIAEREQRIFAETLTDVTLALTSQMNHKAVLNEILRQARRLVPYRTAHIVLLDGDVLTAACWQGYEDFGSEEMISHLEQPLSEFPLDAEVVHSKKPLLLPDTYAESRWVVQNATEWVRSHVVFPITLGNSVLGLLRLDADTPHAFSEKTITYLRPLMNAAAIALENTRLLEQSKKEIAERMEMEVQLKENVQQLEMAFEQTKVYAEELRGEVIERKKAEKQIRQRNRELTLLNRIISASARGLREDAILDTACRELAFAFDVPDVIAFLFDETGETARAVATSLAGHRPALGTPAFAVRDHGLLQMLWEEKTPIISNNVDNETPALPSDVLITARGIKSLVMVPLMNNGTVFGAIALWHTEPHTFSAAEVDLNWRVAEHLSLAIARARLDEQHRQLSAAIEQSTESVIITDADGVIVYTNPAFKTVTGFSPENIWGKMLMDFLRSDKHAADHFSKIWKMLRAGDAWQGRLTSRKSDGDYFTGDTAIVPIRNQRQEIVNYVCSQRDVTRELQLEAQYYQAEKMHAIGRLTSGIAHDFNNLLTAINGFAEVLQQQIPSGDPLRDYADRIRFTGNRATNLVDRLLSFSRKQNTDPQVVNLNTIVTDIGKMLSPILGKSISLEMKLASNLWPIKIDATQLEQIVVNLAVNARDAMPDGGKLEIKTQNITLNGHPTETEHDGAFVLMQVTDTGTGMPDDVKAHIFEPFFTTKEKGKGSGLGLATIFGIVQQHKGFIEVDSTPGQGTTFKIYFPRTDETPVEVPRVTTATELPRGSETVLVVEDEPAVRMLAVRLLARYGYTVLEADEGHRAIDIVADFDGQVHLLLSDMIMPQLSGEELATILQKKFPDMQVLLMSGQTKAKAVTENGTRFHFMRKPFSAFDLVRTVRDVLDKT